MQAWRFLFRTPVSGEAEKADIWTPAVPKTRVFEHGPDA